MAKNDGGPAFPNNSRDGASFPLEGMTLRQYYKAAALQGMLSSLDGYNLVVEETIYQHITRHASEYADAMLAEDAEFEKREDK